MDDLSLSTLTKASFDRFATFGHQLSEVLQGVEPDLEVLTDLADQWMAAERGFAAIHGVWQETPEDSPLLDKSGQPVYTAKRDMTETVVRMDELRTRLGMVWVTVVTRGFRDVPELTEQRVRDLEDDLGAANKEIEELEARAREAEAKLAALQRAAEPFGISATPEEQ